MKRFVIRNYGLTRQIPYKDQQVCIANDQAIETDDEELVAVLRKHENLHITDRSSELASSLPVDEPGESGKPEESGEVAYKDMLVPDLRVIAKDREIKTSGLNKAELIQALEDYDTADEQVPQEVAV